jgi:hypothetical protein
MEETQKINPEVKQLWVHSLRSGEYTQGKNYLKCNDCYCVLGVLCDLYLKQSKRKAEWIKASAFKGVPDLFKTKRIGVACFPTTEVEEWSGITYQMESTLSAINDRGETFESLAEYIEKHF